MKGGPGTAILVLAASADRASAGYRDGAANIMATSPGEDRDSTAATVAEAGVSQRWWLSRVTPPTNLIAAGGTADGSMAGNALYTLRILAESGRVKDE